jgi:hypothetical protein
MAKKIIKKNDLEGNREVFVDFGHRVKYGLMDAQEEQRYVKGTFSKSNRSDYARVIDIRIPQGYHAQVKKSWEMYELDRLFRYLIDRQVDFAANGFEWELAYPKEQKQGWWDFVQSIIGGKNKIVEQIENEKLFWDAWSATINKDVPNVLPGLDEVIKWIFKSFKLNAMAPINWEWGTIEVDKVTYEVPIRMTLQNALSTVLVRKTSNFVDEQFWLKISSQENVTEYNKNSTAIANSLSETPTEENQYWHRIPILNASGEEDSPEQGFVLKYQWSPSDNTALNQGRNTTIGQGLYPTPPYVALYDVLMLRRSLSASDLAILDGVIHYILDWSIGDDTADKQGRLVNQPRIARKDASGNITEKSSIQLAKEAITNDNRGPVMQIFHPYYYKLEIKVPDVKSLVSVEKYTHSTSELYSSFGILIGPVSANNNFDSINIQNFEEEIDGMRRYVKRFFESLCSEIVRRNEKKLTVLPNMIFNVLNTKLEAFRESLINLMKIGKVSTKTLLQAHDLDDKVEIMRIGKELASGEKELTDKNVPISYKQVAVGPDGEIVESTVSSGAQGGRPTGKTGKNKTKKELEE